MAIALNPKRPQTATPVREDIFIDKAGEMEDAGRRPIVVRIPGDLLARIDVVAKRKSLSRSAFIASTMADVVNGER